MNATTSSSRARTARRCAEALSRLLANRAGGGSAWVYYLLLSKRRRRMREARRTSRYEVAYQGNGDQPTWWGRVAELSGPLAAPKAQSRPLTLDRRHTKGLLRSPEYFRGWLVHLSDIQR